MTTFNDQFSTREEWLNAAAEALIMDRFEPHFSPLNIATPTTRFSINQPDSRATTKKVLGTCWSSQASDDNSNQIFITAEFTADQSVEILAVLVHELVHAFDDNTNGHNQTFASHCKAVGLQGGQYKQSKASFMATVPTTELTEYLTKLVADELGAIPHAALNTEIRVKPKQKNRQLLMACTCCDFKFRASKTTIATIKHFNCLACDAGVIEQQR